MQKDHPKGKKGLGNQKRKFLEKQKRLENAKSKKEHLTKRLDEMWTSLEAGVQGPKTELESDSAGRGRQLKEKEKKWWRILCQRAGKRGNPNLDRKTSVGGGVRPTWTEE